jgi:hypothetical protein
MKRSLLVVLCLCAGFARADARDDRVRYWTSLYKGEDLVSGEFACQPPSLPTLSRTREEIIAVKEKLDQWSACYHRFADNINLRSATGQRIPAQDLNTMTAAEVEASQRHVDEVYAGVVSRAREQAAQVTADADAWMARTRDYVAKNDDPSHGFAKFLRSTPGLGDQTQLTQLAAADERRRSTFATTGVAHR